MHQLAILLLLLWSGFLSAQAQGDIPTQTIWHLELQAGTNFALSRKPVLERIDFTDRTLQLGWRLGAAAIMGGRISKSSLVMGLDLLNDRVDLNGYAPLKPRINEDTGEVFPSPRIGTLRVNETQLRGLIGHRIDINPVTLQYGLGFSAYVGGGRRFDFVQTTLSFTDPITGQPIPLEEPLISSGNSEVPKAELNKSAYGGLIMAVGYAITPRLNILLDTELGLVFRNGTNLDNRYKQDHFRLGIVAAYSFYSSK